ncbi:TPA: helix-turn-helix transcriptional regulator [Stenotrophomonas maltophilia]
MGLSIHRDRFMNHQCNYSIPTNYSPNIGSGPLALPSTRSMRVLRKKDLAKKLSCSESTIDNRLNPSSPWHDETFPRPVPLGAGGSRSSAKGWIEYVIDEWLESRMEGARRM